MVIVNREQRLAEIPEGFIRWYFSQAKTEQEWESLERIAADVLNGITINAQSPE